MPTYAHTLPKAWLRFRSGTIPCGACGIVVVEPVDNSAEKLTAVAPGKMPDGYAPPVLDLPVGLCSACNGIEQSAHGLLLAFPNIRASIGSHDIALHRLTSAMYGLDAIGVRDAATIDRLTEGQRELRRLLDALAVLGGMARWTTTARTGMFEKIADTPPSSQRWGHVSEDLRQEIRSAVAGLLARRVERPRLILAPSEDGSPTGCMLCGVEGVEALREDVPNVWTLMSADPAAIGGHPAPDTIDGVVCSRCDRAIDAAHGVGQSAMTLSVRDFLGLPTHLRSLEHISLIGWAVMPKGTPPNAKPWEHADLSDIRHSVNALLGYRPLVSA